MSTLHDVLRAAQQQGLLGPGPLESHIEHAQAFATAVDQPPMRGLDLGSGAGVPGLVLAAIWPDAQWALLDGSTRRADFLRWAVDELGYRRRVEVVSVRAEVAGRDPAWRGRADLVVARSFGLPAAVAECAAPLLAVGGLLVVAEPPGGAPQRWPEDALAVVGLVAEEAVSQPFAFQRLRLVTACPERYPRRVGVPFKRPLFTSPSE